ncbi:uncharacterized protein B0I26_106153 [Anoxybacillus vitaminiphilus]|uniref:DUF418 domain-containing protein n=1 Tax=Paranoxybacillus vitaminiphilus TaxID=581036 RepID=A0A327YMQ5_9BACL|nr:DUF418 domain-containing protein [Anoxybacillus vitaminiphilus]RAK19529.1 uncharacterized protein B0I26_106153 [Anoxybacillus vitaminiphilus]
MNKLTPISMNERIEAIDMMRGLAILGIFFVNMQDFNSPVMYLKPGSWWKEPLDHWTEVFIDIFAQASFYTLFSFLFGFGMVIFQERALAKGYSFPKLFCRRLLVLLGLGCIHAFLIWHGDILISYALLGFVLLLFHQMSPRGLLVWALLLLIVPNSMISVLLGFAVLLGEGDSSAFYDEKLAYQALENYRDGTWFDIFWQRWNDWMYVNGSLAGVFFLFISLLPLFLLGAYFAKKRWFVDVEKHSAKLKKIWIMTCIIGFSFKLLPYLTANNIFTEYMQDAFGGSATAVFYAASVVIFSQKTFWKKIFAPLAVIGRMSLSNYLFQSVLCTLLFYNYGLGWYGRVRPFYGLLLTIVIYCLQIVLSKLWLKYYRIGPVEWIWRTLTYGRKQPFKRTAPSE